MNRICFLEIKKHKEKKKLTRDKLLSLKFCVLQPSSDRMRVSICYIHVYVLGSTNVYTQIQCIVLLNVLFYCTSL